MKYIDLSPEQFSKLLIEEDEIMLRDIYLSCKRNTPHYLHPFYDEGFMDVFMDKIRKGEKSFDNIADVCRFLRNSAYNKYRDSRRQTRDEKNTYLIGEDEYKLDAFHHEFFDNFDIEKEDEDFKEMVKQFKKIATERPECFFILCLRFVDGMRVKDIAKYLSVEKPKGDEILPGTITTRIISCKDQFKRRILEELSK